MKTFGVDELDSAIEAAAAEPVAISDGESRFVLMSVEHYEWLLGRTTTTRAYTLENAPQEDIENIIAGFKELLDGR